jgi:hypothetical protein
MLRAMDNVRWLLAAVALGAWAGCASSSSSPDSGPPPDSGPAPDAGPTPDSGPAADSGPTADSGQPDSGAPDGGFDAGPVDAGCNGCDAGTCRPDGTCGCTSNGDCADSGAASTCCSLYCVNVQRDIRNCGTCGNACAASAFCNGTQCLPVAFQNICAEPSATVLFDARDVDGDAGVQIASLLTDGGCSAAPAVRFVTDGVDAGVLDSTGRPVVGGSELLIAPGGPFVQAVVSYLEQSATAVFHSGSATGHILVLRADGGVLVDAGDSTLGAHHDFFVLELVREPINGSLTLIAYGFAGPGTPAGAWYLGNVVLPDASTYPETWLVVEWTDTNNDGVPNAGDTFSVIASGL